MALNPKPAKAQLYFKLRVAWYKTVKKRVILIRITTFMLEVLLDVIQGSKICVTLTRRLARLQTMCNILRYRKTFQNDSLRSRVGTDFFFSI